MELKIKSFIPYIASVLFGFFTLFVFWQLPYNNFGWNGFVMMAMFGTPAGAFLSIFQMINFLITLAMIVFGIIGILSLCNVAKCDICQDSEQMLKINRAILLAFAIANVVVLLFMIVAGTGIGFGSIFNTLVPIAFYVYFAYFFGKEEVEITLKSKTKKKVINDNNDDDNEIVIEK